MTQNNVQLQNGNGSLAGLRNQFINGDFNVWQRGNSGYNPASIVYGADRWCSYKIAGGATGDYELSPLVPDGFAYSAALNSVGGAIDIRQMIELRKTGNAGPFTPGTTWTLSFYAQAVSGASSVSTTTRFAATTEDEGPLVSTSPSEALTANWQRFTHTFTIATSPVASSVALRVVISFADGADCRLTGVQLEPGPVATPFERLPIGLELSLCQRYYFKDATTISGGGTCVTSNPLDTIQGILKDFPVTMRAIPTLTLNGTTYRSGGNADAQRICENRFAWGMKYTGNTGVNAYPVAYATGGFEVNAEL